MQNEALSKGQPVAVRCHRGEMRRNIVWEDAGSRVYVCSPRQYEALMQGLDAPPPIGFPARDVQAVA